MKTDWKLENIPIPPVKLFTDLDPKTGVLKLTTHVMGVVTEEIANLNSQAIRESLISMGWTPPETGKAIKTVLLKMWDSENRAVITFVGKIEDAIEELSPESLILKDEE